MIKIILSKIKNSFIQATKGRESIRNLTFWFIGFLPLYAISYKFLFNIIVISAIFKAINIAFILWHIFVIFRCKPKEKKDKFSIKKTSKSIRDKVLLRKPWIDLRFTTFLILIDIIILLNILK